jgi:hypothetical protein
VASTKVATKVVRVVSRVVPVGVLNSKIRTQTAAEVFGTISKTILGTINDSLFFKRPGSGKRGVIADELDHLLNLYGTVLSHDFVDRRFME